MSIVIFVFGLCGWCLLKWLLQVVIILFGLLLLIFIIGCVMFIDLVLVIVGLDVDQSIYQQVYQQLGFDKLLIIQFGIYFVNLLYGDLGNVLLIGKLVVDDIICVFLVIMELVMMVIIVGVGFGILLGVLVVVWCNSVFDYVVCIISLVGYLMLIFWVGMMGLLVFYVWFGWVGGVGRVDFGLDGVVLCCIGLIIVDVLLVGNGQVFWNVINYLIFFVLLLGFYLLVYISCMICSFMLVQLLQEFIIIVWVKGLIECQVIWNYVFCNIFV